MNAVEPPDVIDRMVELRLQLAELEGQIDALKPAFFAACAAQDALQLHHNRALISRRLTPGQWDYPEHILSQERQLKRLKQDFQATHEPVTGREIIWAVKLITDES